MLRTQRQGQRRVSVENKWSDMAQNYLRQLKLIGLRYAIWPRDGCLYQGVNADRALTLAIIFASQNSMHGRLASDFMNGFSSGGSYQKVTKGALPVSATYSLNVAFSLLILLVGDRRASPLLDNFEKRYGRAPWWSILGEISSLESRQRPPLPSNVASRAISFLLNHRLAISNIEECRAEVQLLVDLTLLLATRPEGDGSLRSSDERKYGKFWAVQLVQVFLDHLVPPSALAETTLNEWTKSVVMSCLAVAVEVTSVVIEIGESNVEHPRIGHRQLPGGVEAPFQQRHDLNRMLNSHRASQKRRKLGADDAIRARQVAYEVIARTATHSIQRESRPFELPVYLLRCSIYEDNHMQPFVSRASASLLSVYSGHAHAQEWHLLTLKSIFDGTASSRQQIVVPLLPAVLDAVCSDSPSSRLIAIDWIEQFLWLLDAEAAWYLLSFLRHDSETQVTLAAERALANIGSLPIRAPAACAEFTYVDSSSDDGRQRLEYLLHTRLQSVSADLGVATEMVPPLLSDFKFSVRELSAQLAADRHGVIEESGLSLMSTGPKIIESDGDESICGICYDEMHQDEAYALECGHTFCRECWMSYLHTAGEGRKYGSLNIRCPQQGCSCRMLARHFQDLSQEMNARYDEHLFRAFLEYDSSSRACPGSQCNCVAILVTAKEAEWADTCHCTQCDSLFCFGCGEEPHPPATCLAMAEWARIQSKSNFWVRKNAKPCPGCHAPIEKNQGCNHMTCTCGVEFCWLCLTQLQRHSENHTCNRFHPEDGAENADERRALFVAGRYDAHLQAEVFAENHLKTMSERPEKLVEIFWFLDAQDETTLIDALFTLCKARKFLRNSYVASFGLRDKPSLLNTLENYQSALEMLTERLSQLTETNLQLLYNEKGESAVKSHFHGLGFYRLSVFNYMARFRANLSEPVHALMEGLKLPQE